eukprot:scaffold529_cov308-Pinguiococcus_pyrenoidosus.AAC.52
MDVLAYLLWISALFAPVRARFRHARSMARQVRVLVAGDDGVGKSSIIFTLVSRSVSCRAETLPSRRRSTCLKNSGETVRRTEPLPPVCACLWRKRPIDGRSAHARLRRLEKERRLPDHASGSPVGFLSELEHRRGAEHA